ncbi:MULTISPECIES: RibD family protein [unclassified Beijerinckia]|uniref:RibD family protein n=1 Tax=unclassified Beijerinckia TaxID=2638183 RepID=UPI00089AE505|nr:MULTISPECIES: RibD family protein [unclassified Beijerinckia]MDH7797135.1 diaminohydroxyphosphoribosylaminopyrimidine deaminase/5-amino-6-(5-phosphoribosylamino)uracil reductase [Beijerinckia sp. GAS462]SEC73625.1 riboflavin-specific deaminase C-terminal domain-containing protein [Beijerinckia sp. 28-YEA-48]
MTDRHYEDILAAVGRADRIVLGQIGQSLDGRIATASGESKYINGQAALAHLHQLRANVDAVLIGAGTLVADDPQLNVRFCNGKSPARIVIDPSGRGIPGGRWLAPDGALRLALSPSGKAPVECDEVLPIAPHGNAAFDPQQIVRILGERGFHRVLVEGGSRILSAFLDADALDRLHVMVAPLIIGSGRIGLDLAPLSRLADARRPQVRTFVFSDGDVLFDCDLRSSVPPTD